LTQHIVFSFPACLTIFIEQRTNKRIFDQFLLFSEAFSHEQYHILSAPDPKIITHRIKYFFTAFQYLYK